MHQLLHASGCPQQTFDDFLIFQNLQLSMNSIYFRIYQDLVQLFYLSKVKQYLKFIRKFLCTTCSRVAETIKEVSGNQEQNIRQTLKLGENIAHAKFNFKKRTCDSTDQNFSKTKSEIGDQFVSDKQHFGKTLKVNYGKTL